ncbi:MAG: hypothetical protein ACMXYB_04335 [Candidatus Woesearchaeota archaeon]
MEQQQITPIQQFTYQVVVGNLAKDGSQIAYNSLLEKGLMPANLNTNPDSKLENSDIESVVLNYSALFSGFQYESQLGRRELDLVSSNIEHKFGGLESLLSLPQEELASNLGQIQIDAIKNAYSVGIDGSTQLSPEKSALMYVTNGGIGFEESLKSIESILKPELSDEQRRSIMGNFSIVAASDMYARALRAEQVFGVKMIGEDGQLRIPNYESETPTSIGYKDAA